jgi:hypothetical protein
MSPKPATVVTTLAVALLGLGVGVWALRAASGEPARRPAEPTPPVADVVPEPPRAVEPLQVSAPTPKPAQPSPSASASSATDGLDESSLMDTLRSLRSSDPERTLRLARAGNERFKDSHDAGERAWFVVKALSDLQRHDEARVEGRALVDKYRGTRWAEDVYRHLFVNPPSHPFERGYGKQLESDP